MIGHKAENLGDAAVVVTSNAIRRGNPEVDLALEKRIPVVRRAEMLEELMRLQSTVAVVAMQCKTAKNSLAAALLESGDPAAAGLNGRIYSTYGPHTQLHAPPQ